MHLALRHLNEKNDDGKKNKILFVYIRVGISARLYRDAYAADSYTTRAQVTTLYYGRDESYRGTGTNPILSYKPVHDAWR